MTTSPQVQIAEICVSDLLIFLDWELSKTDSQRLCSTSRSSSAPMSVETLALTKFWSETNGPGRAGRTIAATTSSDPILVYLLGRYTNCPTLRADQAISVARHSNSSISGLKRPLQHHERLRKSVCLIFLWLGTTLVIKHGTLSNPQFATGYKRCKMF